MLEYLILIPNFIATYYLMYEQAHKANCWYLFGYMLMIGYNVYISSNVQILYFTILWVMTYAAIMHHFNQNKNGVVKNG